ncbi:MAG: DUF885 domain-containing protein [Planctomycetota bacterium]|nr:MAG: DUF885 domain-containing protein [Planctomycetota bacterium]
MIRKLTLLAGFVLLLGSSAAAEPQQAPYASVDGTLPPLRAMIERYSADRRNLGRFYDAPMSARRTERYGDFYRSWQYALDETDFDALDHDGQVDYILFRNELRYRLEALEHERAKHEQLDELIPFAQTIVGLQERRRQLESIDPEQLAVAISGLADAIEATRESVDAALELEQEYDIAVSNRAAEMLDRLQRTFKDWYGFYNGYDPLFSWWVAKPYAKADKQLTDYTKFVRKSLVGIEDEEEDDPIIGDPIGRAELLTRLEHEMIPYTPEELLVIAETELAWCRREMLRAAADLGFGDDWRAALEHVKDLHVGPGEQPQLVHDLAWEAIEFLEQRDLVTIPALCKETWRMEMMSPERQKTSPYFLGGEVIMVAFPTDEMAHEDKRMSMRGNNMHFARATVHHELIPGHHLQGYMTRRYRTHRRVFGTPFWGEGWALYWEMLLWDLDFPESPENRVGMLFWRTHRCARIIFSLSFHLGLMTPEQCIEFLIENVGHERNNATAEVRRSVSGDYGPLYQAAYMLGGLQIRAMHRELVDSGTMTNRQFHDAVLRNNSIPIEMVRAAITDQPLTRDFESSWRFYGDVELDTP